MEQEKQKILDRVAELLKKVDAFLKENNAYIGETDIKVGSYRDNMSPDVKISIGFTG